MPHRKFRNQHWLLIYYKSSLHALLGYVNLISHQPSLHTCTHTTCTKLKQNHDSCCLVGQHWDGWHNSDTRALCSKSNPQEDYPGLTDRSHEIKFHSNFTLLNNRRTVENLLPHTRYLVVTHTHYTHTIHIQHTHVLNSGLNVNILWFNWLDVNEHTI